VDWGVETSVGVEYAHALAPAAKIVVAVSPTDDTDDVTATEAQILPQFPGAIVSQSFGDDETDPTAQADFQTLHNVFMAATTAGGTILAGAGDFGAADCPDTSFGCGDSAVASYPASDPFVTGVGGTEGNPDPGGLLNSHGQYGSEQVWNETGVGPYGVAATGGAPSVLFPAVPAYQQGIPGITARDVPDVSFYAAIEGGIRMYDSDPEVGGFVTFGGTSAGPPQWAAIIAIADQARAQHHLGPLGNANTALYAIASDPGRYRNDFHDITVGTNAIDSMPGYTAGPGYDLASGLGTPDASRLIQDLATFQPPPPQNVTCSNQQLTGTYHDVNVPKGAWCDLSGATVQGNFHADQTSGVGISGSTINGDVQINHATGATDPSHPGANVICGSTLGHDLQVQNSNPGVAWSIGGQGCGNTIAHDAQVQNNAGPLTFSNNNVGHDLQVQNNAGPLTVSNNTVGHDVQIHNNRTGAIVSGNQVSHDLQCQGNGPISGSGNTAGGHAQGQCSTRGGGSPS
jgi:subtilase family serine protease